jgi:hypothetical protein
MARDAGFGDLAGGRLANCKTTTLTLRTRFVLQLMEELSFKIVKVHSGYDEPIAYAANLLVGRAAYETAVRMYPRERIEMRQGAQVIEKSREEPGS